MEIMLVASLSLDEAYIGFDYVIIELQEYEVTLSFEIVRAWNI